MDLVEHGLGYRNQNHPASETGAKAAPLAHAFQGDRYQAAEGSANRLVSKRRLRSDWQRSGTLVTATVFLAVLLLAGCASPPAKIPPGQAEGMASTHILTEEYRIGVDDLVSISVWRNPDLSVTVPVRPDGMISVPLVGDVLVGDRTPEEVSTEIEESLSYYVRAPKVAVIVAELRSHEYLTRVRVTGAVRTPVSLPYRQGMTVLDAVLVAGSTNEFADPDRTRLHRRDESGADVYDVNLGQILLEGELDSNYELQPGDIISVPERRF